jgi:tetratricopeptide (TPR) repeat protein
MANATTTTTAATTALHREVLRLLQAKDWPNALLQIDAALRARPGVPHMLLNRAQCLLALGRRTAAREAAAQAMSRASGDAAVLDSVGSFFSFVGDQRQALEAFERAVALAPDNAHYYFNRATVRRFLGQLAAAEADYDRVIALRPGDFEAYHNRSDLRTQTATRNHIAELERLVTQGFAEWRGEVQIRHSLAKEYEDLGDYPKSFEHLRLGAKKRRENLRYDVAADVATVDWIIEAFPSASQPPAPDAGTAARQSVTPEAARPGMAAPQPTASGRAASEAAALQPAVPIFIVGLPRSGTTLVDRIVSSHSQVESAGELNDFALALVAAVRNGTGVAHLPRRELVAHSARIDFAALGRSYLERVRTMVATGRFTDKMPLNYLYCGLIRRALPNAKIVHLTRHPMAVGYAMYKTLFKDGYPFSYDLGDIAKYYAAYRRLMDHWCATMPGYIYSVSYESLVADQQGETRKLLDFCGLEWQDACLDFHRNSAATTTASASQIRRPIYDSSVSQWRHYTAQLEPLRKQLNAAGMDL